MDGSKFKLISQYFWPTRHYGMTHSVKTHLAHVNELTEVGSGWSLADRRRANCFNVLMRVFKIVKSYKSLHQLLVNNPEM